MKNCKECGEWNNVIDGVCLKCYGEKHGRKDFERMSEEEKLSTITKELDDTIQFIKSIEGTGRMYDSSVRLTVEQLEWLISKVK